MKGKPAGYVRLVGCAPYPLQFDLSVKISATKLLPRQSKTGQKMIKQHKTTVKKNLYISLCCFVLVNFLNDFAGFHTVEVTGSIPVPPTMKIKGLRVQLVAPFLLL